MKQKVIELIVKALRDFFTSLTVIVCLENPDAPPMEEQVATPSLEPVAAPAVMAPVAAPAVVAPVAAPAVVAPPVVAAPAVVAPPVVAAPAVVAPVDPNVQLDAEGLPWDVRIHSGGKTTYARKAANGTPAGGWKLKKNVTPAIVAQVKTELRVGYPVDAVTGAGVNTGAPPALPSAGAPPAAPGALYDANGVAIPATPGPGPAAPVNLAEYGTIATWGELMRQIVHAGMDKAIANAKCVEFGVASLAELQNSPALIPAVAQGLGLTK